MIMWVSMVYCATKLGSDILDIGSVTGNAPEAVGYAEGGLVQLCQLLVDAEGSGWEDEIMGSEYSRRQRSGHAWRVRHGRRLEALRDEVTLEQSYKYNGNKIIYYRQGNPLALTISSRLHMMIARAPVKLLPKWMWSKIARRRSTVQ